MELLKAEGISMHFGGVKAVNQVDLSVEAGSIVGIIGPNGSGKTTFFNVITGVYRPTAGRFSLDGKDVTGLPIHRIAACGISRTFQNIRLFRNMSVLENVLVGEHMQIGASLWGVLLQSAGKRRAEAGARDRAMKLLDFVRLSHRASQFAANLAYGEQRRLEIARALATQPRLLLLDEPTAGMNPSEAAQIMDLIHAIQKQGMTIILIEHNMQVMMGTAERIVALDAGIKIAEGTPREIQYDQKVIQAYLGEEE